MAVGARVFCDQDGELILMLGESSYLSSRKEITSLHCIDMEYGALNTVTHYVSGVDMGTMEPIVVPYLTEETEDQKTIKQLQDDV
ncbi:hypothetical protein ACIQZG_07080 [Lysinibacillus sp. NPDC096418]|uniref:hypothetical protein n=1 Tax=Lysinibacillus sp. NPDC096418 TaxID=3364138 RepID=UPI003827FCAD